MDKQMRNLLGFVGFCLVMIFALLWPLATVHAAEGDLRDIKLGVGATQYQLLTTFPAAGQKCLRYMDGADGTLLGKTVGCFPLGPQFVIDGTGALTVPVTKGDPGAQGIQGVQGSKGDTGSTGANGAQGIQGIQGPAGQQGIQGAKGDTGATGANGLQGVQGFTGPAGTTGAQGATGSAGPAGTMVLRMRATTGADGTYTWTFPTAFAGGTIPVVAVSVEGSATVSYQHVVTAISNTSVSVRVVPVTDVTLLGIHILGIQSSQATVVHLLATAP